MDGEDKREAMTDGKKTRRLDGSRPADVREAAELLRRGELVAFPTETVYGLGADARNGEAIARIFAAKGRPSNNPLIVHVDSGEAARQWCAAWPEVASILASLFWPGPLTMVLPAAGGIAPAVLAGGTTVGLRVPRHPVALALLDACGFPLAAPSANRSNRLSPTSAQAVADLLGDGACAAILDGGPCEVGIESTVLDLSGSTPLVLRPGGVSREELAEALGRPVLLRREAEGGGPLRSPGMLPRHYSPRLPLSLVDGIEGEPRPGTFLISLGRPRPTTPLHVTLPPDPELYARRLYECLLRAEESGAVRIVVERPPAEPGWMAILDRLARAATPETTN